MRQFEKLDDFVARLKLYCSDLDLFSYRVVAGQLIVKQTNDFAELRNSMGVEVRLKGKGVCVLKFSAKRKVSDETIVKAFLFPPNFKATSYLDQSYIFLIEDENAFDRFRSIAIRLFPDCIVNSYIHLHLPCEIVEFHFHPMPELLFDIAFRARLHLSDYFYETNLASELVSVFRLNKHFKKIKLRTPLYTDIFYHLEERFICLIDEEEKRVLAYLKGHPLKGDELLKQIAFMDCVRNDPNFQKVYEGVFLPQLPVEDKKAIVEAFRVEPLLRSSAVDKRKFMLINLWKEYEKVYILTERTQKFSPEALFNKYRAFIEFLREQEVDFSEGLFLLTVLYGEVLAIKDINVIIDFWGDAKRVSVYLRIDNFDFWLDYEDFVDFKSFVKALRYSTSIYDFRYYMERKVGFSLKADYFSVLHSQFLTLLDFPQFCEIYLGKTFSLKEARAWGWKAFFYSFVNKVVSDINHLARVRPQVLFESIDECLEKARKLYAMQQLFDLYFYYSEETDGIWAYVPYCSLEAWLKINHYRYWNVKNLANFLYTIKLYQHALKNEAEDLPLMFYEKSGEEFWCFKLPERLEKGLLDLYKSFITVLQTLKENEYVYTDDTRLKKLLDYLQDLGWIRFSNQIYELITTKTTLSNFIDMLSVAMRYKISSDDPLAKKRLIELLRVLGKEVVEIEDMVVVNPEEKEDVYLKIKPEGVKTVLEKDTFDDIPF